jgi:hypothetical protein
MRWIFILHLEYFVLSSYLTALDKFVCCFFIAARLEEVSFICGFSFITIFGMQQSKTIYFLDKIEQALV